MATTESNPLPKLEGLKVGAQPSVSISDAPITPPINLEIKMQSLKAQLSEKATINLPNDAEFSGNTVRWSTLNAPSPVAVVNVATESDIAATVKWAVSNNTKFLAQSGGHGFTSTVSSLGSDGIVINLRAMNEVKVDLEKGSATIGAGTITQEALEAAHAAGAHIMTGVCNSVGVISPLIGGGLGNLMALYGLGVDNMLSARLVTSTGDIITVSATENSDLWWGLRGAGHNFGIVSQLTVKAHKQVNGGVHWAGTIGFPGSKENVQSIVDAINELGFGTGKPIGCTMVWARIPPQFQPMVMVNLWCGGTEEDAKEAFAPLLNLGPVMNMTGPTPYPGINAASDFACIKNGHKRPGYGVALKTLSPEPIATFFNEWEKFTRENQDAGASVVLTECYDFAKTREVDGMETAFPWRDSSFYLMAVTDFTDGSLEEKVKAYGDHYRALMEENASERNVYVNFATGDEPLEKVYGGKERLERLRGLKTKWDPEGVFSCYNPIK